MTIHIETQALRETSAAAHRNAQIMWEALLSLRRSAQVVEMAWQGGMARDEFLDQLHQMTSSLEGNINLLDQMGLILSRQSDRWEESDQTWQAHYRQILSWRIPW
jgi:uncharacterized protein YukE